MLGPIECAWRTLAVIYFGTINKSVIDPLLFN